MPSWSLVAYKLGRRRDCSVSQARARNERNRQSVDRSGKGRRRWPRGVKMYVVDGIKVESQSRHAECSRRQSAGGGGIKRWTVDGDGVGGRQGDVTVDVRRDCDG